MLIKAFTKGNPKVFVGEREVVRPADLGEAIKTYGNEKVLKGFWKSEVIAIQASIRAGANGKGGAKTQVQLMIESARKQKADGDATLYDNLVALDIIKE
jgi:hypothetical protein